MRDKSDTYSLYALIASPKIHTDLLWDLAILFAILCILYFGVIFFFRDKLSFASKVAKGRKKELSPMISAFLFYDETAPKEEKTNYVNLKIEIRELLNYPSNRKVLIDVLMDLRKDLSGTTLTKLFELYESLGLHHDSYKKLESWRWQAISKGISELTQMNVEESYVFVRKFINDKRSTVRKQAEIAIITLKHEGINFFLDTTTYRISEWQQLKILEVLKNKKDYRPPSFKLWLISKNKDVVLFALRLMKHYNQSDGNQALIELLKHKNDEINVAAIVCIKEFHVIEAVETLKLVFWNSFVNIKIAILDTIAALGSTDDIEFLKSVGLKESNFNVKSKALASINAIAPMSVLPTIGIQKINSFNVPADISSDDPKDEIVGSSSISTDPGAEELEVQEENTGLKEVVQNTPLETKKESGDASEDIARVPEEVLVPELPEISEKETERSLDNKINKQERLHDFSIDFLPLVAPKEREEVIERYHPEDKEVAPDQVVMELDVVFEEVTGTSPKALEAPVQIENESDFSLQTESLDFLPVVIPSEETSAAKESCEKEKPDNLLNMEVFYSEIEVGQSGENKILSELNALVPLPKPPKIKNKDKVNVDQNLREPSSINKIDMKKVNKIECKGVEIRVENQKAVQESVPAIESEVQKEIGDQKEQVKQNVLDWIMALNDAQVELKQKIKSIVTKQEVSALRIPKPIFYTDHEANTVALLDDIEALGDKREIPLLQDMLLEKENSSIHERIEFLIEKISDTDEFKKKPNTPTASSEPAFSVFEEFFRTVDTEAKLILLDEIVAVGDEKEIDFLKRLVKNAVPEVKKKAKVCLEGLTAKLAQENYLEHYGHPEQEQKALRNQSSIDNSESDHLMGIIEQEILKPFDVFDIDFELTLDENEKQEQKPR